MSQFDELPEGWTWIALSEIASIKGGLTKGKKRKDTDQLREVPYLRVANVQRGYLDLKEIKVIEATQNEIEGLILLKGDILFNEGGDRDKLGRGWIWSDEIPNCIHQNHVFRARLYDRNIEPVLISLYSNNHGQKYFLGEGRQTTNLASINLGKLSKLPIPLPPLNEQRRIVEKIEALTARSRKARAALDEIPALLDQFRQSVLAAAFRGDLTADWRAKNPDVEAAEVLLERIRVERRDRWEKAELRKIQSRGKAPQNDRWKEKYKEPVFEEYDLPHDVPESWAATYVGEISDCLDSMRVPINKDERSNRVGEIPYYGANGQVGWIDEYIYDEELVIVVEDETFIGRTKPFSYKISGKSWVNNHAHVLRPVNGISVDFLNYSLMFYPFIPLTSGTTGRRKLTQKSLMAAPYKLPPLQEQDQIVALIEKYFSLADALKNELMDGLSHYETLDQSILAKAFRGELVPQDPNDEPAAVLIDRIRAEREQLGSSKKRGKAKA